jgi:thiamine-monophosphate kinase
LVLGPGDDAALLRPSPGTDTVLTCDLLAEGVHFDLKLIDPWALGARAAAANLSDLAAMGAAPRSFLASVAVPKRQGLGTPWLEAFHKGLHAWMQAFGAVPAGGDLSASRDSVFIDITAIGEVERGRALKRSGARPGDLVFLSGPLGGSAAGLALLQKRVRRALVGASQAALLEKRHRLPVPRVLAGRWLLQERAATACIDISDGLASEAWHLSRESGLRLDLQSERIPLERGAAEVARALKKEPLHLALHGGEDYELLFTVPRAKAGLVEAKMAHYAGCEPVCIGETAKGKGVRLKGPRGWQALPDGGYEHFR